MNRLLIALSVMTTLLIMLPVVSYATEIKELELVNSIESIPSTPSTVVVSPRSDMLLIRNGNSSSVYLYRINDGIKKELMEGSPRFYGSMCFNADGSMIAINTQGQSESIAESKIYIIDAKSGEVVKETGVINTNFEAPMVFDNDNNLLIATSAGEGYYSKTYNGINVFNLQTESVLRRFEGLTVLFCQNSINSHITSLSADGKLRIFDGKTGGSIKTLEISSAFNGYSSSIAYSPNGKYLVVSSSDKTIIFDAENNYNKIREVDSQGRISYNTDSDILVVGNTVYFAADDFTKYTRIRDRHDIDVNSALLTQDSKYYISYRSSGQGIRLLDATPLQVRLKEIHLESQHIELLVGGEIELSLTGIYSDGSTKKLNLNDAQLIISDFAIARKNGNTKIQALSVGEAGLGISYQGFEIKTSITVMPQQIGPSTTETTQNATEITVLVNGEELLLDQPAIIMGGRTLVPLRAIFEALGSSIDWNGDTQTVTAVKDDIIVFMQIGNNVMSKNNTEIVLDVSPQIVNERTLVPARAVAESFGVGVDWDTSTQTVILTSN